ncbi:MAG: class I SAM-dependent methyltransferase [Candidatus Rifleibacteriota bacterium]
MTSQWKNESGDSFEQHGNKILKPVYNWLLKDLENHSPQKLAGLDLLEIGCGPGFMNSCFATAGIKKIIELDISHSMLLKAKSRSDNKKTLLLQASAEALPLASSSVDVIFSRGSIFFWPNIKKCFSEIHRILKQQGLALIGGGYGLSIPDNILSPIIEHAKQSRNKKSVPRLDLDQLKECVQIYFPDAEILQAPKRGFWLKCRKTI